MMSDDSERVFVAMDMGSVEGSLMHFMSVHEGLIREITLLDLTGELDLIRETPVVVRIAPLLLMFEDNKKYDFPIPEQIDFYLPREKKPKIGVNLHVGRHGEMPIPSGQRRKIKRWKRK